jgi:hypothetical protein
MRRGSIGGADWREGEASSIGKVEILSESGVRHPLVDHLAVHVQACLEGHVPGPLEQLAGEAQGQRRAPARGVKRTGRRVGQGKLEIACMRGDEAGSLSPSPSIPLSPSLSHLLSCSRVSWIHSASGPKGATCCRLSSRDARISPGDQEAK